jgi:hypothetical protein
VFRPAPNKAEAKFRNGAGSLLIALWRLVTTGETLEGVILRPAG